MRKIYPLTLSVSAAWAFFGNFFFFQKSSLPLRFTKRDILYIEWGERKRDEEVVVGKEWNIT